MDELYTKTLKKYKGRRTIAILAIIGGVIAFTLTMIFIGVDLGGRIPAWNQYHSWALGLAAILITAGAILLVSALSALRDLEKTVNRLNPDEREQTILEKAKVKTLKIYTFIISPITFIAMSVLLMLEQVNFIAWIIYIVSFLSILITHAIVRAIEYKKY